jgi:hypothetical protein
MSITPQLRIGVPETILSATAGTGDTTVYALPARSCVLAWQTSFDTAPSGVSITIQVSIDGTNFTTLDTSTATAGEVRTISTVTSALFIKANVGTNTGNKKVTITLIAKVANP